MHRAILLSQDLSKGRQCSMTLARRLLSKGLARIIHFYPYTLQLKNPLDQNGKEPLEDFYAVTDPQNEPPDFVQRLALKSRSSKNKFKVYRPFAVLDEYLRSDNA